MSDFEILYIVLMIISIIVTILIEYINNLKKSPPSANGLVTFLTKIFVTNRLSVVPFSISIVSNLYK